MNWAAVTSPTPPLVDPAASRGQRWQEIESGRMDPRSEARLIDVCFYLPGDILTKVDRASMHYGLEVRVPILDHSLVEWVSALPPELKLRGREGKYLLKKSLEPLLPNAVLYRPKMGFSVPLTYWFRGPLKEKVRDAVLGPVLAETGMFERSYLSHLLDQHQSGLRDYSAPLWSLLMFEAFLRRIGQDRSSPKDWRPI